MCLFGIYCGSTTLLGFTLDYDKNILTLPCVLGKHHIEFSNIARIEIARSGDGDKSWFVSICTTDGKSQSLMGDLNADDAKLLQEYLKIKLKPTCLETSVMEDTETSVMEDAVSYTVSYMRTNSKEGDTMICPKCLDEIHCSDENYGLMWCANCKSLFSCIPDEDGNYTHFFSLPENHCEIEPGSKVFYENENGNEIFVTSRFSFSGIIMAIIAAGWLFITIFSFSINIGLGAIFCVLAFFLTMISISSLYSKISVTYCPAENVIIYRRGPFKWWRIRNKIPISDVESIQEGAAYNFLKEIPRPAIFFHSKRSSLLLDFTANKTKQDFLWLWLMTSMMRGKKQC